MQEALYWLTDLYLQILYLKPVSHREIKLKQNNETARNSLAYLCIISDVRTYILKLK